MYSLSPLLTSFSLQSTLASLSSSTDRSGGGHWQAVCWHFQGSRICPHVTQALRNSPIGDHSLILKHFSPWEAMTPYPPHSPSVFLPVSSLSFVPLFLGSVSKVKMPQDLIFLLYIFSLGLRAIDMLITPGSSVRIHTASNQKSNSVSIKVVYWLT